MKKLSDRALELLQLVDDYTVWKGDTRPGDEMTQFFEPSANEMWCPTLNKTVQVSGPWPPASFSSLALNRLIRPEPGRAYSASITEKGLLVLADMWQDIERLKKPKN